MLYPSGDVGYYDEDGYFFVVDRIKELIKFKGLQVNSRAWFRLAFKYLVSFSLVVFL